MFYLHKEVFSFENRPISDRLKKNKRNLKMAEKKEVKPKKKATPKKKTVTKAAPKKTTSSKAIPKKIAAQKAAPRETSPKSSHGVTKDERNWGMFCQLGALAGFIIPFGNIIGPLIIWLVKREESPFIDAQGKEALNFQISMTIYFFIAIMLVFVFVGIILIPILILLEFIFIIVAALKAQDGGVYHYPFSIRFV